MNLPITFTLDDIERMSHKGSPALLSMAGRAIGLGADEQQALANGKLPAWFWVAAGVLGGVVIGVQVQRRWPQHVPNFVGGKS